MTSRLTDRELTQRAIGDAYRRANAALTVEDALVVHNELIDLFAAAIMQVKASSCGAGKKAATIRKITARAQYHRDVVDRLTDIVEANQQLIWRP